MAGLKSAAEETGVLRLAPGLLISAALAIFATFVAPFVEAFVPAPPLVIALLMGIWLHPWASRPLFAPGLRFCISRVLRIAIALLGLRVALGDIAELGLFGALVVVVAMVVTIVSGVFLAQLLRLTRAFGALAGMATGVCGASAALATASVLPAYKGKEADAVFVIIAVNLLSTIAMLTYPLIGRWAGFGDTQMGVLLGGTIHDVVQVVGAGYSVSDGVGAKSVIVKLFRVLMLLPVILVIGRLFASSGTQAKVPVPVFAFAFLALCCLNSAMPLAPPLAPVYAELKSAAGFISHWGLLLAIASLGLSTSVASVSKLGIRHILTVTGTTLVILAMVVLSLMLGDLVQSL